MPCVSCHHSTCSTTSLRPRICQNSKHLKVSKQLRQLDLFVDPFRLLRVGGRIDHSDRPYEQKHPLLIPKFHRLTELIIDKYHHYHQHLGAMGLQCVLQCELWFLGARQIVRSRLRKCVPCYKLRPRSAPPKMGIKTINFLN